MESFWKKILLWNKNNNDLPHKVVLCLAVIFVFFLGIWVFPYVWPFVVGALLAMMIEPLVKLLHKIFKKLPFGRVLATSISMLLLLAVLSGILILFFSKLFSEVSKFATELPGMVSWADIKIREGLASLSVQMDTTLSQEMLTFINNIISEIGKSLVGIAASLSRSLASGAMATATSIPMIILSLLFTILSTFYISIDKEKILHFFHKTFPVKTVTKSKQLKKGILKALGAQIKSQLTISAFLIVFLIIGLSIIGISYPHLFGLLIGLADALPIVGAGLFLIPWSIISFLLGNTTSGFGMAILYIALSVFRQIIEPRIVGKNLGLYPLATMFSIYLGYKITGSFLGMIAGPILLNICKVVLSIHGEHTKPDTGETLTVVHEAQKHLSDPLGLFSNQSKENKN
ncbi:MAG: sporulation integral membrane protein YtvI [Clostridiales bacterium]|nr:sporulation integral membrane protein YtvI [Clostridiales bacterium]